MFISALQPYAVAIIIVVIGLQYAFALFCLFKLAYLDITKKEYVLWNLFILLIFFIGGISFLIYYNKVKGTKLIPPFDPKSVQDKEQTTVDNGSELSADGGADNSDNENSASENGGDGETAE